MLAEYGVDGLLDGLTRVARSIQETQWIAYRKPAVAGSEAGVEDRGAMGGDGGSNVGGGDLQGQSGRDPCADGRAGDDVEDVAQGALGSLLDVFEDKRRVEAPEAAAAQAEELAMVGGDGMADGIEFDPGVSAHG